MVAMKKSLISKKTLVSLLWLMPLIIYEAIYLYNHPFSSIKTLARFNDISENLFLWNGLFLLGILILLFPKVGKVPPERNIQYSHLWSVSFSAFFTALVFLVIYVNPHGRYPWNLYPFTTTAAHYQKIVLYEQLDKPPQVIVLGSSRAYTISAAYIAQTLGKETFNMAVGSAGPVDQMTLARYIVATSPAPQLFIVELVATDLSTSAWKDYMPLNLLPYMSINNALPVIKSVSLDTLSLRSLTDSLFLLFNRDATAYITFQSDGTGERPDRDPAAYQRNLKNQIPAVFKRNRCSELDVEGQNAIKDLAAFSEQNGIGIVFYRSPLNVEFYKQVNQENPLYKKCQRLFSEYIQVLTDTHPNVFYVDLIEYEPISSLREEGYIDVQHLHPHASNLVIDALHDDLQKALQWADENR